MSSLEPDDDDCRAEIPALLSVAEQQQNQLLYEPKCRQRWGWHEDEQPPLCPDEVAEFLRSYAWLNETELALQCLFDGDYHVPRSVEILHAARREKLRVKRDEEERIRLQAFEKAMARHGKMFHLVTRKLGRKVTTRELVSKFYLWKHTPGFERWHQRQQNKEKRGAARLVRLRSKDHHKEHCEACFKGGKLLCCDGCNRAYHLRCVQPPVMDVPEGDWFCSHCRKAAADDEKVQKAGVCALSGPGSSTELETISNGSSCEAGRELPVANHGCDAHEGSSIEIQAKPERQARCTLVAKRDPDDVCVQLKMEEANPNEVIAESMTDVDESDGSATSALLSRCVVTARKPTQRAKLVTSVGESRYSSATHSLEYLSSPPRKASSSKLTPLTLESVASSRKRKRQIKVQRGYRQIRDDDNEKQRSTFQVIYATKAVQ